ncbi:MAG: hypothetical protein IPJ23_18165 [Ignavibacteriales bacterium]|nr:hypothetical protein [Ignavibacteriales bacterium]
MKNSFVLAVLVTLFVSSHTYSQGIFLDKGEAGLFLNGGYTGLESGYAASFGGGFALGGIFEFGFSTSTSTIELDNYYYSKDIHVSSNSVSLGVVLIKKKAQLELNLGYSTSDLGSDAIMVGFNVGSKIPLHKDISWYPILSFAVGIPTAEHSGNPVTAVGATLPIFIAKHFYLGPSFGLSDGNTSWGFTVGILISFSTAGNGDSGW